LFFRMLSWFVFLSVTKKYLDTLFYHKKAKMKRELSKKY